MEMNQFDFAYTWNLETNESSEHVSEEFLAKMAAQEDEFALELDCFDEKEQEDKLWQARTGLNNDTLCGAVETIIFMNDRPVSLQKIKTAIDEDLPLRVVHEAIAKLQQDYEMKHHGIRLQEVAEGYQFRTKATYSKFVQDMFKVNSLVLSPTALEVLAIIAYKQPVSKTQVDSIRGVDSSHIVRGLMDKRLVKVVGRSEEAGRPSVYGTTSEFLEVFNLADLSNLPPEYELEEIASGNSIGAIADIKSIVGGDKTKFNFEEADELEQLSETIKQIASDTLFTKTLTSQDKQKDEEQRMSAFDILEEFVNKSQTLEQNQAASISEVLTMGPEAKVVDLKMLKDALLNAPEIDEDEIEQILDSVTANSQLLGDIHSLGQSLDEAFNLTMESERPTLELVDDTEDEAKSLELALDKAFESLSIDFDQLELSDEEEEDLESNIEAIDAQVKDMKIKAQDLDIDLDFLDSTDK